MYTYPWYHWITFFYIYCFFGWIFESTYVSLKKRKFVNRGFLRIPMLPLYGTGAVMMLWVSLPVQDNLILVYLSGVVAATALEYVTGYVMERLFKIKYWDYSNQRFQVNGYICLSSSIAWGFLTIFLTEIIHRPIADFVLSLNPVLEFGLLAVVSAVFAADTIQSTKEALALGRMLESMTKIKAEMEEMQLQLALLRAEASQRLEDIKSDARQQMDELRLDAQLRVEELKTDALVKAAGLKEDTALLAAELKENTLQKAAQLKDSARQTASELEKRSAAILSELKQSSAAQTRQYQEEAAAFTALTSGLSQSQLTEKIRLLTERHEKLMEYRQSLFSQMNFYRRELIKGNPSASSGKFAEALRELREVLEHRH